MLCEYYFYYYIPYYKYFSQNGHYITGRHFIKFLTRKDYKKFVRFPTELYRNNPNYIPPMESDEYKMATKRNAHFNECSQAYFLAEQDGKIVGRVACVVMHKYNEKNNCTSCRCGNASFAFSL